jgi:hypothetical protein
MTICCLFSLIPFGFPRRRSRSGVAMLHGRFIFRLGVGEWVMMLVEKYGLAMPLWHILGLGHVQCHNGGEG